MTNGKTEHAARRTNPLSDPAEWVRDEKVCLVQDEVLTDDQVSVHGHIQGLLNRGMKRDGILLCDLLAAMGPMRERTVPKERFPGSPDQEKRSS